MLSSASRFKASRCSAFRPRTPNKDFGPWPDLTLPSPDAMPKRRLIATFENHAGVGRKIGRLCDLAHTEFVQLIDLVGANSEFDNTPPAEVGTGVVPVLDRRQPEYTGSKPHRQILGDQHHRLAVGLEIERHHKDAMVVAAVVAHRLRAPGPRTGG